MLRLHNKICIQGMIITTKYRETVMNKIKMAKRIITGLVCSYSLMLGISNAAPGVSMSTTEALKARNNTNNAARESLRQRQTQRGPGRRGSHSSSKDATTAASFSASGAASSATTSTAASAG